MRLIRHSEISGRIYTLLDESDERVIIVSPYIKIASWHKLTKKLRELNSRNIPVDIYVRDDPENKATYNDLRILGLPYKKIPYLHSKLYMNEKQGILTSMNLLLSSEINSLEVACITENQRDFNDLKAYYRRYIQNAVIHTAGETNEPLMTDQGDLKSSIDRELRKNKIISWLLFSKNSLEISTSTRLYRVRISRAYMSISTKINAQAVPEIENLTDMLIDTRHIPGSPDLYMTVYAQKQKIKSRSISAVLTEEVPHIIEGIRSIIVPINDIKI